MESITLGRNACQGLVVQSTVVGLHISCTFVLLHSSLHCSQSSISSIETVGILVLKQIQPPQIRLTSSSDATRCFHETRKLLQRNIGMKAAGFNPLVHDTGQPLQYAAMIS